MAAIPTSVADSGRRSSSSVRREHTSHGRGGAGNIGASSHDFDPVTLETPTLKGEVYTTGRGGSGNMARNDDAAAARRAQDVTGQPRRESTSNTHVGRGGAANVFKPSAEDVEKAKQDNAKWEDAIGDDGSVKSGEKKQPRGFADKGKDWLFHKESSSGGRPQSASGDEESTLTSKKEEKKPLGLADKGKDWIAGAVSGVVSGRK